MESRLFSAEKISPRAGLDSGTARSVGQCLTYWAMWPPEVGMTSVRHNDNDVALTLVRHNLMGHHNVASTSVRCHVTTGILNYNISAQVSFQYPNLWPCDQKSGKNTKWPHGLFHWEGRKLWKWQGCFLREFNHSLLQPMKMPWLDCESALTGLW